MIITGIDPGLTCTGIAVIETDIDLLRSTLILTKPKDVDDFATIINAMSMPIGSTTNKRLNMSDPTDRIVVAIEEPVLGKGSNARSLIKQAMLIGAIITSYSPVIKTIFVHNKTAKKFFTGNGNATKDEMVEAAVKRYGEAFHQGPKYQREAVADAIAIALTAASSLR